MQPDTKKTINPVEKCAQRSKWTLVQRRHPDSQSTKKDALASLITAEMQIKTGIKVSPHNTSQNVHLLKDYKD